MRNKFCVLFLLIAIVTVLVLGIVVFLSLWDSLRCREPDLKKVLDYFGRESDLCLDSASGANTGFVANTGYGVNPGFSVDPGFTVNPYQAGNSDRERDLALIIGSSISYILGEVKYFTLFIVVLTVLALNAYALIIYFILDKAAKPGTAPPVKPETRHKTMGNTVTGHFIGGKVPEEYIKQTSGMKRFSLEIDEMLAEINLVMERSKLNQGVLVK